MLDLFNSQCSEVSNNTTRLCGSLSPQQQPCRLRLGLLAKLQCCMMHEVTRIAKVASVSAAIPGGSIMHFSSKAKAGMKVCTHCTHFPLVPLLSLPHLGDVSRRELTVVLCHRFPSQGLAHHCGLLSAVLCASAVQRPEMLQLSSS